MCAPHLLLCADYGAVVQTHMLPLFDDKLPIFIGLSAKSVAAKIGNAEFLDPEMRISPSRGPPPRMINLSIN